MPVFMHYDAAAHSAIATSCFKRFRHVLKYCDNNLMTDTLCSNNCFGLFHYIGNRRACIEFCYQYYSSNTHHNKPDNRKSLHVRDQLRFEKKTEQHATQIAACTYNTADKANIIFIN